jgi:hypothetical protein
MYCTSRQGVVYKEGLLNGNSVATARRMTVVTARRMTAVTARRMTAKGQTIDDVASVAARTT